MTDLDDQLARALRDAVPSPPRALDPAAIRGGTGHLEARRWLLPALAAAAVVAVVAAVLILVNRSGDDTGASHPAGPPTGTAFEVRPLLLPAQQLTQAVPRSGAFADLAFPLPITEDGYHRLSGAEQGQLRNALSNVDCGRPPVLSDSRDQVVCSTSEPWAALLGPPIVTSQDVVSAEAQPPALAGYTEWTVLVRFTAAGADSMRAWTAVHHSDASVSPVQTGPAAPCGPAAAAACSDFLAFVVGDRLVTLPITHAALDEVVQISGGFDEETASEVAREIAG